MKDGMKNGYSKIDLRCTNLSSLIMGDVESDEHLRIFKCLIDTGSLVLRNAIGIKLLNNNSISFVQYLENNKHQFYHQFEKRISRKCCLGSPHGCVFNGTMDKHIFYKMYTKRTAQNTRNCLDRFEINTSISLDILDLSDLYFLLWNSRLLSTPDENSLKKIMCIRSEICHPPSSRSYSIVELKRYWSDLESAVLVFAEPKCYKDIVEMQIKTLQNCNLNALESAKIIEKISTESDKIMLAIQQETPLKIVDIEKLIKDGICGFENCVKSENNKTKSYINDTFQDFKESIEKHHEVLSTRCREEIQTTVTQESSNTRLHSEDQSRAIDSKLTESEKRVCQTVIQSQGRLEDKLIEEQHKTRNHTVELKADLIEENRILKDEVMDVKTELKELKTILIGYIGKQKVDLVINTDQIGKSTESPDTRKVGFTAKVNQTHVTADEENEIIEKLPPEVKIQTNNEGLPDAAVTETIEITGKKVNSIILELKATPGILHMVETFKAAILSLVQVIQKAGGIDADIEDTVTVNLKFESPLTEDQFAVVKCLFAKEWNTDNDTTQLPETSEVFELETTKPLAKTFCQLCHNKDKRIKALEEQNEKHEIVIKRNMLDLQAEKRKLEDLQAKHKGLLIRTRPDDTGMISMSEKFGTIQKELKSSNLSSFGLEHTYDLQAKHKGLLIRTRPDDTGMISMSEKFGTIQKELKSSNLSSFGLEHTYDSSSKKSLNECRHCYEMEVIIIQLDRRLCEIRRRIIEAERQSPYSVYVDKVFEDILQITDQNTSITSIEEKGRMKDKELRRDRRDRSSQDSKLISDVDVHDPEKKANKKLMESQTSQGRRPESDQTEEKSDLSLRLSEIRREYADSLYTKTDKQKGLGIILQGQRSTYFQHARDPVIRYLQEFFEEIGFVSEWMGKMDYAHLKTYMSNQNYYCIFIVFRGHGEYEDPYLIQHLLSQRSIGKPVIIMTDFIFDFTHIRESNEDNEKLIVMPIRQRSRGPYGYYGEKNICKDFVKATRRNRFADIMDILTQMNALYDYPIITFQSSLRKKFCFL